MRDSNRENVDIKIKLISNELKENFTFHREIKIDNEETDSDADMIMKIIFHT